MNNIKYEIEWPMGFTDTDHGSIPSPFYMSFESIEKITEIPTPIISDQELAYLLEAVLPQDDYYIEEHTK